ncbi:MAG: hypothetical protein E8D52_03335 [Nitrospira sp.]|nr:MAG: hypothetical protein E8D52_03335 [Nitrospira sp.]
MPMLFHQNMRNFNGANAARNAAYVGAFGAISAGLGAVNPIAVAGFTELTSGGNVATALGGHNAVGIPGGGPANLCAALNVQPPIMAACGLTALANGKPEFIGISISSAAALGMNVLSVGRIFLHSDGKSLNLIDDRAPVHPPPAAWCDAVHPSATHDYRGVVYVVVQNGAGHIFAVGFLHNMYSFVDQKVLVAGKIPSMMSLIGKNPALGGGAIYLGGDFNVDPVDRTNDRLGIAACYSQGTLPAAIPAGAQAGGTTWHGNLYDYWYANHGVAGGLPAAHVRTNTLDTGAGGANTMSDHVATLLAI